MPQLTMTAPPSRHHSTTGWALGGALAAVSSVAALVQLSGDDALLNWTFTHWAFTYDHGPVKRALVGEMVQQVAPPGGLFDTVWVLALILAAVVAVAACLAFWAPFVRDRRAPLLVFGVIATTHVATVQHVFYDLGRFDQIGLLLALAIAAIVLRWGTSLAAAAAVAALSALALLVHEAFLLMYSPVLVALLFRQAGRARPLRDPRLLSMAAAHGAVLGWLVVLGPPEISEAGLLQDLSARHGDWIHPRSVKVLYSSMVAEAARAVSVMASVRRVVQHGVLALALLPTLWLGVALVRARRQQAANGAGPDVTLLAAALSPLLLYPLGIDFARWWAAALTNVLLVVALLLASSEAWRAAWSDVLARHPLVAWTALLVNAAAGPIGVASSPFPRLEPAIVHALNWLAGAAR